eukprot:COSAG01_NODE_9959_length_2292_cov_1.939352_3_plen_33_part_00
MTAEPTRRSGLQALLITVEMFLAALLHRNVFR